jgi:hypothetical protein
MTATTGDDLPFDLNAHHQEMERGYKTFERIIERFYPRDGPAMSSS